MPEYNDYMNSLRDKLAERGLSEGSIKLYISNLATLNRRAPFTNLNFLKKTKEIEDIMRGYSEATQRSFLTGIISTLNAINDSASFKKVHEHYSQLLAKYRKTANDNPGKRSLTQKANWVEWDDVLAARKALLDEVMTYNVKDTLTEPMWENILKLMVLSLYTEIPPRRNLDYMMMYVVNKSNPMTDSGRNYYIFDDPKFVFNRYKTQYKYGQQVVDLSGPDNKTLVDTIRLYLSFHPAMKGKKLTKHMVFPFLAKYSGDPLTTPNSITRLLNSVFKKNVGSSLLRHIYLTSKYGSKIDEMKADAVKMAHSTGQQRDYILPEALNKDEPVPPLMEEVNKRVGVSGGAALSNLLKDDDDEVAKIFASL